MKTLIFSNEYFVFYSETTENDTIYSVEDIANVKENYGISLIVHASEAKKYVSLFSIDIRAREFFKYTVAKDFSNVIDSTTEFAKRIRDYLVDKGFYVDF